MYEKHFGLNKPLFSSRAGDHSVFVGPQQAKVIRSLGAGLAAVDSIVTVSGPVGVGKTTIVKRALESISPGRMVASVGRMALAGDEVLQLLLTGFGISREATGTVQRFAAFRRLLAERAAAGAQFAIVVEDAMRVGEDALVEMEALTATDSGDETGANIILMGQPELNEWLTRPALARLRQRTRLRIMVEPFNAAEVQGYLRHSIREAGGEIDKMLDAGAIEMLYRCSEGIPRVINNLCESALAMAVAEKISPLDAPFIQRIAKESLGIDVMLPPASVMRAATPKPAAPAPASAPSQPDIDSTQPQKRPDWLVDDAASDDDEAMPGEISFEVEQTSRMQAINADKIAQAKKEGKDPATFEMAPMITVDKDSAVPDKSTQAQQQAIDDDLPMLSQSMRIDAPRPATAEQMAAEKRKEEAKAKAEAEAKAKAAQEAKAREQAKAKAEAAAKARAAAEEKAKAEAAAKAKAKAEAQAKARAAAEEKAKAEAAAKAKAEAEAKARAKAAAEAKAKAEAAAKAKAAAKTREDAKAAEDKISATGTARMPDIETLEAALAAANEPVADDDAAESGAEAEKTLDGVPALTLDAALDEKRTKADPVSPETAEGLGKAESLGDLTDTMAETLFGNSELGAAAAEALSNAPPGTKSPQNPAPSQNASPTKNESPKNEIKSDAAENNKPAEAAARDPSLILELVPDTLAGKPGESPEADKGMGMSTTRRLDLIKQLNSGAEDVEEVKMGDTAGPKPAKKSLNPDAPAPLEDQFATEMTTTLKAITSVDDVPGEAEDDQPKKKTGLFSRFSRS